MKYQTYIFDLDGTLIDSGPAIVASLSSMQQQCHLKPLDEETLRRFIGPPLNESMVKYYGVLPADTEELLSVYRQCYLAQGMEQTRVFDGVLDLLTELRQHQARIAVATIKQYSLAKAVLKRTGIQERIDYAALDPTNQIRDKTPLFVECLKHTHTAASDAIVIGDSPMDGYAANQAGIDFLALAYGESFRYAGALEDIPHVYAADSVMDMRTYLLERGACE